MQIKCGHTISDLGLNIIPAGPQIEFESAHLISKTNKTVRLSPGANSNDQIHPTLWNRLDDLVIPMQCTETFCLRVPIQCKMCHQVAVVCILRRGCQPLGTIHMLCVPRTSQHARTPSSSQPVDRCTDLTPLHSCTVASFSQPCHAHLTHIPQRIRVDSSVPQNRLAFDMVAERR